MRHLDSTKKGASRRLTLLYYANTKWLPEHGGCLRVYLPSGPVDIEPRGDRLLVFQSRLYVPLPLSAL